MNRKTVFKIFLVWNYDKEERWLNEMAQQGWALMSVGFLYYVFERCEPGAYTIRLEMHKRDESYVSFIEQTGAEYVGRMALWIYFRKSSELGPFDLLSDLDSKIEHLGRISTMLTIFGVMNLGIGVHNSINGLHIGWINLLCATLLMYALGRIQGMKAALENERQLHE